MFKKNGVIRQRVMVVIDEHIEKAEIDYAEGVAMIESDRVRDIESVHKQYDDRVSQHLDNVVRKVIGKVL